MAAKADLGVLCPSTPFHGSWRVSGNGSSHSCETDRGRLARFAVLTAQRLSSANAAFAGDPMRNMNPSGA
ncbi:MAG: hypothetical protein JWN34_1376 [Bryobacterales bacterium]|nr:hypothetical protein [Bryobacterales bacterium]